jgi:histidine triad (HIT) family protein
VKKTAFPHKAVRSLARSWLGVRLIGWIFASMSFMIPVKRLRETDTLLAFYHPSPSYAVHILIVPKKVLPGLQALSAADQLFMIDLYDCVRSLVNELQLEDAGYRLIANGGAYQDFPQLHFHLIAD